MKEWKIYQQIYHSLVTEHSDAFETFPTRLEPELVQNALAYFKGPMPVLIYPAKSYAVAIIYALLLAEHYGEDVREVLDDPDLLFGKDPYFVPYRKDPATYEAILSGLASIPDWRTRGWVPKTIEYFHLECTKEGIAKVNQQVIK